MARSRTNGIVGDAISLNAYFYKNDILTEPSSIGPVKIKYGDSIIASYAASNVESLGDGIKRLNYQVEENIDPGKYSDIWTGIVFEGSDPEEEESFEHIVRSREWYVSDSFSPPNFNIIIQNNQKFKLYEKKWLKFDIQDANGRLRDADKVTLLLKDFNGSNVYLSSATVNDGTNAYYFFNSSELKATYPDYILRENTYEWIFKVYYNNQEYQPDPVLFEFSET
jgi:hypothetical protein